MAVVCGGSVAGYVRGEPPDAVAPAAPEIVANSIGMQLARIPAGTFLMGAVKGDEHAHRDELPRHAVQITRPFYLGTCEVTVGQFRRFAEDAGYKTAAESEPSSGFDAESRTFQYDRRGFDWRNVGWEQSDDHPVLNVCWSDAVAFCAWLSRQESRTYRLPTEAEWEFACRAGTEERFIDGPDLDALQEIANVQDRALSQLQPRFSNADSTSYFEKPVPWDDGYPFSAPVGSFRPNQFGLFDMLGNAAEWCQDWYDAEAYRDSLTVDPAGPAEGEGRVVRGGAFLHQPRHVRTSQRISGRPSYHNYVIGFRVLMEVSDEP
jgi:formylglycine-generating enzyme required for sulfatase activity